MKDNLKSILDVQAMDTIDKEIIRNTKEIYSLAYQHYLFSTALASQFWRQIISRFYYAGYHSTRCVRFYVKGSFMTDSEDHKRFKELPDDFPDRSMYINQLEILREDRNLCDYDHTAKEDDLVLGRPDTKVLIEKLLQDVKTYMLSRGVRL